MPTRMLSAGGLRVHSQVVEREGGRSYPRICDTVWDAVGQRLWCSWRYVDAPYAYRSSLVTADRCWVIDHRIMRCRVDEPPPGEDWSLEEMLGLAGVDELWMTAFTGRLHEAARSVAGRRIALVPSDANHQASRYRVEWEGSDCALEIDREDGLPRRLETRSRHHRAVKVAEIEWQSVELGIIEEAEACFDLSNWPADSVDSKEEALRSWPERMNRALTRPQEGEVLPEGIAFAEDGSPRTSADLRTVRTLVAFWHDEESALVQADLRKLQADLERSPDSPRLVFVHYGPVPRPPVKDDVVPHDSTRPEASSSAPLPKKAPNKAESWTSPKGMDGLFRRFGVYRCPVFILVGKDGVVELQTRSLPTLRKYLNV